MTKPNQHMPPFAKMQGKPKNLKQAWGKLFRYAKPYYAPISISMIFAIICTALTLIGPSYIEDITNYISSGLFGTINISAISKLTITLAVMYFISFVLNYLVGFIMSTVTRLISKRLRKDISRKINVLPLSYIDKASHGDLLSRITNDIDTISQSLDNSIITIISSLILIIGSLIMMFIKSWILALSAIGASILGFVLVSIIMTRARKYFIAQQKSLGELNGHVEEVYGGHTIIKAYNAEKQSTDKFQKINGELYNSAWKSTFMAGLMMPIMSFIGNLGFVVVCVVGSALVIGGHIEIGAISAFMLYIRYFTQPLTQLAQVATSMQSAGAASERVFELLDQPELADESDKKEQLIDCRGDVEFKNVKFGYTSDKVIINNFSASIKAGQKVAIVGPTGAGKTTLVNLLMLFYEIDDGEILIDGINTKSLTRDNIHNLFSMVLQDTWIYNGSIFDNVVYSKQNITKEQVEEACTAVGLHHFIKTLPNGYDTILDDNTTISQGQKQLLTIARAMIQDSPMLILDEATSSVDTRLEILIQQAMDKLTQNRTSFVIAHRLSTIKNADLILVMKDGDVIESGTHKQLINLNCFYADLYNSQFEE